MGALHIIGMFTPVGHLGHARSRIGAPHGFERAQSCRMRRVAKRFKAIRGRKVIFRTRIGPKSQGPTAFRTLSASSSDRLLRTKEALSTPPARMEKPMLLPAGEKKRIALRGLCLRPRAELAQLAQLVAHRAGHLFRLSECLNASRLTRCWRDCRPSHLDRQALPPLGWWAPRPSPPRTSSLSTPPSSGRSPPENHLKPSIRGPFKAQHLPWSASSRRLRAKSRGLPVKPPASQRSTKSASLAKGLSRLSSS